MTRGKSEPVEIENTKQGERSKNHVWIRLSILLLIVGGLTLLLYKSHLINVFLSKDRLIHLLDSLGIWGFAGFVILQALQVVVAPIPGEATGLLGGYLYGPLIGIVLSTLGLTLGSFVAFVLSRTFGRPFVERFVSPSTMSRFDYLLHHKGAFLVFLLFLVPGFPKDYLCYILGLGHLSTMEFIVIGGAGRLFGTVLLTMGGVYIRLHQYWRFSILVGVALILVLLAMAYKDLLERWFRRWHLRSERKKNSKCTDNLRSNL